jgi:hypothetical protein
MVQSVLPPGAEGPLMFVPAWVMNENEETRIFAPGEIPPLPLPREILRAVFCKICIMALTNA